MKPKKITFFGETCYITCDRKCEKAWGFNTRPYVQLSDDVDDIEWLADHELGVAPTDTGVYEGGDGKPQSPSLFPNKWCIRECERSNIADTIEQLNPPDFSTRLQNIVNRPPK